MRNLISQHRSKSSCIFVVSSQQKHDAGVLPSHGVAARLQACEARWVHWTAVCDTTIEARSDRNVPHASCGMQVWSEGRHAYPYRQPSAARTRARVSIRIAETCCKCWPPSQQHWLPRQCTAQQQQ